ncbi:MAG: protein kinase domain-containing protein, partial [Anaerolineae bacterium]
MDIDDTLVGRYIERYKIIKRIGHGGMAEVYKGLHPALHRHVAIKVVGRHLQANPEVNARFQREARAVAALRHPNIVQIFDFGRYEGGHYMVMEYVEGTDLRAEMDRRWQEGRAFTPEEIMSLAEQVASALDYAHSEGVIHRDVKPSNVLLNTRGDAILGDFGLAMLRDRLSQATLGHAFGTPEYVAPEQAMDSRAATPQSDIYSLGGILYEMTTGQLPFEADSAISLALKHINEEPKPLREHVSDLPPAVETVILKSLAKDPGKRYATALALVTALRQAWTGEVAEDTLIVQRRAVDSTPSPEKSEPKPSVVDHPTPPPEKKETPPPQVPAKPASPAARGRSSPREERKRKFALFRLPWSIIGLVILLVP